MTAIDPTAHLTAEQIEELGRELDAIRDEVIAGRGEKDVRLRCCPDVRQELSPQPPTSAPGEVL
ncbi:hypothetical protein ACFU6S_36960 [Streptomyces sp. NPDC057456]|uniref:hypothetical protein n=1 Tax=Streptomyces sp. NPDC057456 TaxID=3346139 RepID=UPI0036A517BF